MIEMWWEIPAKDESWPNLRLQGDTKAEAIASAKKDGNAEYLEAYDWERAVVVEGM